MRIAVVSPFVDRRHGTERALAELLERLARIHHCEIHLYAQRVEDLELKDLHDPRLEGAGGIFWHKVPSLWGPHLLQFLGWISFNGVFRWRDAFFRRAKFDLVLSPGINCLDADLILVHALFHRLKELSRQEMGGFGARSGVFRSLHRRAYYGLLAWLESRIYGDPHIVLAAVSKRTAGLLEKQFHRSGVCMVPNGVDAHQFSPAERLKRRADARLRRNFRETDFVMLLIGNDWRTKGLATILAAMASIPELPLHIVAAGADATESFSENAKRFGMFDRCHWEPPRADVMDLYATADAYVSPSREDAFALPPLEAMACGLPVITSASNGGSQIISESMDGFVLEDPLDSARLAQILTRLHGQPEFRVQIGENAARTAQTYTWDRNAEKVWELLTEVAAKRAGR